MTEDGFYEVEFTTGGKKGFWPNEWDEYKVLDEIKYVLDNQSDIIEINSTTFLGKTETGQYIGLFFDDNNIIKSAFPVFDVEKFKKR